MLGDRRGAVTPLMTLMLIPLIGAIALGTESSGWFFIQRAAQNAADAAVMAAASNASTTSPTYSQEALGTAASYGFATGSNNVTVSAVNNATCPPPSTLSNCYQVTITQAVPIAIAGIVGYNGNTTVSGNPALLISATAMANAPIPATDCVITNTSFRTNGAPKFKAGGCTLYSNGTTTCNGSNLSDLGFAAGFAFGSDTKCGVTTPSPAVTDNYSTVLSSNPPSGCKTYATPPTTVSSGSATLDWSSNACVVISGNWTINGGTTNVLTDTASANKGTVLYMTSGSSITLNGTLKAAFGQSLTIVFTGSAGGTPGFLTQSGSGVIDFGAPTSGPWSGVALYQDPAMGTSSVVYSGSKPTFNISGLIYAPKASMTYSGDIQGETNGYACLGFIVNDLLINGTGSIFNNPTRQCYEAGLTGLPNAPNTVAVRQALVQ